MRNFFATSLALWISFSTLTAQNIGGIINSYGAVTNMSGAWNNIFTSNASQFNKGDKILVIQMKGAMADTSNSGSCGDIISMGGVGKFEFTTIASVTGSVINLPAPLTHTYDFVDGMVQIVRVPRYCTPVVTQPVTCPPWDVITGTGGIIIFEAGTLTINSVIDASGKGYAGGAYGIGNFSCNNLKYIGANGMGGGAKGEGVATTINFFDGLRGKYANGGGGSNSGNSGAGGGSNAGMGGFGGLQYSGCDSLDARGIGGATLAPSFNILCLGGGGGGGYQDNLSTASNGGNGGGIIYIRANAIVGNNGLIQANGGNVTVVSDIEGSGGGGAGGTIWLECPSISGIVSIRTNGGFGGNSYNTQYIQACHGTGGGGGGGFLAYSPSSLPNGITYFSNGGTAGLIKNPNSDCYNTTHGATAGSNGISMGGLPTASQIVFVPTLTISPSATVCVSETLTLTANGAATYSWSTGSTNSFIVVKPNDETVYTIVCAGSSTNTCKAVAQITLSITDCTGLSEVQNAGQRLQLYPNPAADKLSVKCGTPSSLTIRDQLGRIVLKEERIQLSHTLDISTMSSGVYYMTACSKEGTKTIKFLKVD